MFKIGDEVICKSNYNNDSFGMGIILDIERVTPICGGVENASYYKYFIKLEDRGIMTMMFDGEITKVSNCESFIKHCEE